MYSWTTSNDSLIHSQYGVYLIAIPESFPSSYLIDLSMQKLVDF